MKKIHHMLLAAIVAIPAYANPLNEADWSEMWKDGGSYTFSNGALTMQGGETLLYTSSVKSLMRNDSSCAITLQYNKADLAPNEYGEWQPFEIQLVNETSPSLLHTIQVGTELCSPFDAVSYDFSMYLPDTVIIELNYSVREDKLYFFYTSNIPNYTQSEEIACSLGDVSLGDEYWTPQLKTRSSCLIVTDVTIKDRQLVPEPTTATLSLLVLAGLAARRRRATR